MKKLAIFAVIGLLLSTTAFAEVLVLQDGKMMSFKDNSQIIVSGKTTTTVRYNDISIVVPANQKVQIDKRNDEIWISGTNMKGIEVAGKRISSNGHAIVSISLDSKEVSSVIGDISIVKSNTVSSNSSNKKINNAPAKTTTKASVNKTVSFPEVSEYLSEIDSQQSVQDAMMSQSSPSGI